MDREDLSPFDDTVWCLAGANSHEILYAVSAHTLLLELKLWGYSTIQEKWKLLLMTDELSRLFYFYNHHYLMSATYIEKISTVDVFVELDEQTAFIFRLSLRSRPCVDYVLVASDTSNIRFDGSTGPILYSVKGNLVISGSMREDLGERLRLFRVDINYIAGDDMPPTSFKLKEMWRSDIWDDCKSSEMAVVNEKLIQLLHNGFLIFNTDFSESVEHWQPVRIVQPELHGFQSVCTAPFHLISLPLENFFLMVGSRIHQRPTYVGTSTSDHDTQFDAALVDVRLMESKSTFSFYAGLDPQSQFPCKALAASVRHVFWLKWDSLLDGKVVVQMEPFFPPSLQYLCLTSLRKSRSAYKECDTYEKASNLGIPKTAWCSYFL